MIIDVIEVLTTTDRARKYWSDLKNKLIAEGYIEVSEKIGQLKLRAPDGKLLKASIRKGLSKTNEFHTEEGVWLD